MDQNIFIRILAFGLEVSSPGKPKLCRSSLKQVRAISLYQHQPLSSASTAQHLEQTPWLRTSPWRKEYASSVAAFYRASQGTPFSLVSWGVLIKLAEFWMTGAAENKEKRKMGLACSNWTCLGQRVKLESSSSGGRRGMEHASSVLDSQGLPK